MGFRIEHDASRRKPSGAYWYLIYQDEYLVARYWHDYRGDEHGIDFVNGERDFWPAGRVTDFLKGGGPQPLCLSEDAVVYLERKTAGRRSLPWDGLDESVSARVRAVAEVLWRENPLQYERHTDDVGFADYDRHVSHIAFMIQNGCRAAEIANYLEKITGQRGMQLTREAAARLADGLLKSTAPSNKSLERTREE